MPKTNQGNTYAVTIQCDLTRYISILPLPSKDAKTVAQAIFEKFILIYGPMKQIRIDMGSEYKNQLFENLTKMLNIGHKTSTAYHSQSIGACERNHRVLNEYLRMYVNEIQTDWEDWFKYYTFCNKTNPSSYHNFTPFELVFARKVELPEMLTGLQIDPLYNIDAYEKEKEIEKLNLIVKLLR